MSQPDLSNVERALLTYLYYRSYEGQPAYSYPLAAWADGQGYQPDEVLGAYRRLYRLRLTDGVELLSMYCLSPWGFGFVEMRRLADGASVRAHRSDRLRMLQAIYRLGGNERFVKIAFAERLLGFGSVRFGAELSILVFTGKLIYDTISTIRLTRRGVRYIGRLIVLLDQQDDG